MNTNNITIIDSNDERAVLRAWINGADMGGWPTDDEDAFRAAVIDEAAYGFGIDESEVEECVVIETTR
ncbi:MAG: hypothetical protein KKH12_15955 [Gammaproteobacteria bacterium]|nr:hypothetical protein [Gammaproteobacteria bacterium]